MRRRLVVILGLIWAASGCQADLGECDEELARTVVYSDDAAGLPAYAGQALLNRSCGNGASCHAEAAVGEDRFGAPFGLDFDMALAPDADSTGVIQEGQLTVFNWRHTIMNVVEDESMPPGEEGERVRNSGPVYRDLPEIDTPEGQDILRNWLACGAPVVERVGDPPMMGTVGVLEPAMPACDLTTCGSVCADTMIDRNNCGACGTSCADDELCSAGTCAPCAAMVSFTADVEPILAGCNSMGCHFGAAPARSLNLEAGMAHASLVGVSSSCPDGKSLVAAGMVDGSYLINKLLGIDLCSGIRMPLGAPMGLSSSDIQIIEAWICGGAADD